MKLPEVPEAHKATAGGTTLDMGVSTSIIFLFLRLVLSISRSVVYRSSGGRDSPAARQRSMSDGPPGFNSRPQ